MFVNKQSFLIAGMGKSGYAACMALLKRGAKCYVFDGASRPEINENIEAAVKAGAVNLNRDRLFSVLKQINVAVISPGIPIDNEIPVACKKAGVAFLGEIELGYLLSLNPIVAVSGTNGKTTTCALIDHILSVCEEPHYLAGNYGVPFTSFENEFSKTEKIALLEISSFQLETICRFSPHIACVLNISPDHLDRHYNMDNYTYLKSRLLLSLRESEFAVLNRDDETVCSFAEKTRAKVLFFSSKPQENGVFVKDGYLCCGAEKICETELLALKGAHNLQNALAATAICKLLGVKAEYIKRGLCSFKGVKHRLQAVTECDGVVYVNDSKATNPGAAQTAISGLNRRTVWLVGGKDKGEGYKELFSLAARSAYINSVLIYGASAQKLYTEACAAGIKNVCVFPSFVSACIYSFGVAKKGDCILLSPACASFDEFSGYEQRGDKFIALVNEYISTKTKNGELIAADKNKLKNEEVLLNSDSLLSSEGGPVTIKGAEEHFDE